MLDRRAMSQQVPERLIPAVNRMVRTSRRLLGELGREATAEELAERLTLPLEKVHKLLRIAPLPATLAALTKPR